MRFPGLNMHRNPGLQDLLLLLLLQDIHELLHVDESCVYTCACVRARQRECVGGAA